MTCAAPRCYREAVYEHLLRLTFSALDRGCPDGLVFPLWKMLPEGLSWPWERGQRALAIELADVGVRTFAPAILRGEHPRAAEAIRAFAPLRSTAACREAQRALEAVLTALPEGSGVADLIEVAARLAALVEGVPMSRRGR